MISGVAKRMAGQFFKAIDDELTGKVDADRRAATRSPALLPRLPRAAAGAPQVFAGRARPRPPSRPTCRRSRWAPSAARSSP